MFIRPSHVGCCWLTMLRPFAWALKARANVRNKSQHCCVLLAINVAPVCMGLKV